MDQDLIKTIDGLAISAGFQSIFASQAEDPNYFGSGDNQVVESEYPHWRSDCAQILLCTAPLDEEEGFSSAIETAQRRLDELLVAAESGMDSVVDGYLLILLEDAPTEALRELVRRKEADPHLCRKHVIWHEVDENEQKCWPRLSRVTVLGLPFAIELGSGAGMPDGFDPKFYSEISDSPRAAAKRALENDVSGADQ